MAAISALAGNGNGANLFAGQRAGNPASRNYQNDLLGFPKGKLLPVNSGVNNAAVALQYAGSERFSFTYSNADGDTVSLHYESLQSLSMAATGQMSEEERNALVDRIKEEFLALKEAVMGKFLESLGGGEAPKVEERKPAEIEGLPEYWNAENTSQRIVDFAVSFYSLAESQGSDYYQMIKAAIEDGFAQAREMMGDLPGAVKNLVDDTYKLTMEKLDAWAGERGISIEAPEEGVAA